MTEKMTIEKARKVNEDWPQGAAAITAVRARGFIEGHESRDAEVAELKIKLSRLALDREDLISDIRKYLTQDMDFDFLWKVLQELEASK